MSAILPGATIGVLGSGQLGRMFAIAARRMGYFVHVLSPDQDSPTGQVADVEITAAYEDLDAVRAFARDVDVVTFEFENVPAATADACAERVPVRPSGRVLHVAQDRVREKEFFRSIGVATTPFAAVESPLDLPRAAASVGLPAVLKTAGYGYDGKGQRRLATPQDLSAACEEASRSRFILEGFVDFEREVSVVAARGEDGSFAHWGAIENAHERHVLDVSLAPARIDERIAREAVDATRAVLEALDVVGVLCVEFFVTRDGRLLANEMAPRPHNSGHLTFDASMTSQFEQQARAACGLPLGATDLLRPAAMANLLGDLWESGEPDWEAALRLPDVKLHLYGKAQPRPGRKMGHLTAMAATADLAAQRVRLARETLRRHGTTSTA
jgi:5-(carboxyamino)imidazole ribonucleotide synthase